MGWCATRGAIFVRMTALLSVLVGWFIGSLWTLDSYRYMVECIGAVFRFDQEALGVIPVCIVYSRGIALL